MADRIQEALTLSEEILNGIELETLTAGSAALRCMRLARLMSDTDAIEWLQFEISGYPFNPGGKTIDGRAFRIGHKNGRHRAPSEEGDQKQYMFAETAPQLEAIIKTASSAIGTLTTHGVSVEGERSLAAMNNLTRSVAAHTRTTRQTIQDAQGKLSILQGMYHAYALKVSHQLKFGNKTEELFRQYRSTVDAAFLSIAPESLNKLSAASENLSSANKESWAQALTSCRRVFFEIVNNLFERYISSKGSQTKYQTRSGKELDVSGDKYLNRMSALVDHIIQSNTTLNLQDSHLKFVITYIEELHDLLCKGVHDTVTMEQARFGLLHTYMALGDLATEIQNLPPESA